MFFSNYFHERCDEFFKMHEFLCREGVLFLGRLSIFWGGENTDFWNHFWQCRDFQFPTYALLTSYLRAYPCSKRCHCDVLFKFYWRHKINVNKILQNVTLTSMMISHVTTIWHILVMSVSLGRHINSADNGKTIVKNSNLPRF